MKDDAPSPADADLAKLDIALATWLAEGATSERRVLVRFGAKPTDEHVADLATWGLGALTLPVASGRVTRDGLLRMLMLPEVIEVADGAEPLFPRQGDG